MGKVVLQCEVHGADCKVIKHKGFDEHTLGLPDTRGDIIGTIIHGYRIIKQGSVAVIGKSEVRTDMFVAWNYRKIDNSNTDVYWGRYGTEDYTNKWFEAKENGLMLDNF